MKFLARLCSAAASHNERTGMLAQVALRGGGCLIPVNIQGQVGKGSQLPDLVEDVAGGLTIRPFLDTSNPNQIIPWFHFSSSLERELALPGAAGTGCGRCQGKGLNDAVSRTPAGLFFLSYLHELPQGQN